MSGLSSGSGAGVGFGVTKLLGRSDQCEVLDVRTVPGVYKSPGDKIDVLELSKALSTYGLPPTIIEIRLADGRYFTLIVMANGVDPCGAGLVTGVMILGYPDINPPKSTGFAASSMEWYSGALVQVGETYQVCRQGNPKIIDITYDQPVVRFDISVPLSTSSQPRRRRW